MQEEVRVTRHKTGVTIKVILREVDSSKSREMITTASVEGFSTTITASTEEARRLAHLMRTDALAGLP